ncbi:MAG: LicD family protein [Prevotella sp.]|nr:LicD family protein [Prevotella sp.]
MKTEFNDFFKTKLLEVFDYTIQFLESNNLRWYVSSGTAIGAVRHHDIIPWDDDIDIFLPREDYDKLFSLRYKMEESRYRLYSYHDAGYYHPYFKIVDMNTTIWEDRLKPCILGVYVDVFPLEDTNITSGEYDVIHADCYKKLSLWYRSLSIPTLRTFYDLLLHFRVRTIFAVLENLLFYRWHRDSYLNQYINAHEKYYQSNGEFYTHAFGFGGGKKDIYEKKWFAEVIKMPFNRLTVNVPIGYHEYLTQVFDDYMTPPPVEKRVDTHGESRLYVNLKERIDIKEIEKRVAKGFTREY